MAGKLKSDASFDFTVSGIGPGNSANTLVAAGPQVVKKIKLRDEK